MTGDSPFDPPSSGKPSDEPPPNEPDYSPPQYSPPTYQPPSQSPATAPAPGFGPPPSPTPGPPPQEFQPPQGYPPPEDAPPGFPPPQSQPQAYQPPQGYPAPTGPPPKKSSRRVWIILGVILGAIILLVGACTAILAFAIRSADESVREVFSELTIDFTEAVPATGPVSCEVTGIQDDGSDDYEVFTEVTNESGVESHYLVDYVLVGPNGEELGTDFGIMSNVAAGALERDNTIGVIDGAPSWEQVECEVIGAARVPAN